MSDAEDVRKALAGLSLDDLQRLIFSAEQQINYRRCRSYIPNLGHCTAEPPHADGWHERSHGPAVFASPGHSATEAPTVVVRWRFSDEVVALEHEHEAKRRAGAN